MNNQSQPSFTQHPSADPTKALVSIQLVACDSDVLSLIFRKRTWAEKKCCVLTKFVNPARWNARNSGLTYQSNCVFIVLTKKNINLYQWSLPDRSKALTCEHQVQRRGHCWLKSSTVVRWMNAFKACGTEIIFAKKTTPQCGPRRSCYEWLKKTKNRNYLHAKIDRFFCGNRTPGHESTHG